MNFEDQTTQQLQQMQASCDNVHSWLKMQQDVLEKMSDEIQGILTQRLMEHEKPIQHN